MFMFVWNKMKFCFLFCSTSLILLLPALDVLFNNPKVVFAEGPTLPIARVDRTHMGSFLCIGMIVVFWFSSLFLIKFKYLILNAPHHLHLLTVLNLNPFFTFVPAIDAASNGVPPSVSIEFCILWCKIKWDP